MTTAPTGFEASVTFIKAPERSSETDTASIAPLVAEILAAVRAQGDAAVREYSERFDKISLDQFEVSSADRQRAVDELAPQTPRRHRVRHRQRSPLRRGPTRHHSSARG